jgi:hypothetical protein
LGYSGFRLSVWSALGSVSALTPARLIVAALAMIALSRVGFGRCSDLDRHWLWSVVALQSLAKVAVPDLVCYLGFQLSGWSALGYVSALTPDGLIVAALALIALSRVGFGRCLDLDWHLPWSVVALQSLAKVVLLDPLC